MKLTNRLSLPQPVYDAIANSSYSKGDADASITELIGPPRQAALKREHADAITEDASDLIWSLLGQAIHTILERANRTGIAERRLSVDVAGWKISGGMDLYEEDGVLVDYKVTSAWSCKGGVKPEWESQLNCYAEILRENGHPVNGLKVVAILRDWSKLEAARDENYPQSQVMIIPVPLWPAEQAKRFLYDRVILHQQAKLNLPLCTVEERWAKPDVFAVMKQGGARAVRLYESEAEAHGHAAQSSALYVVKRPGVNTRCQFYCSVSKFCLQWKSLQAAKTEEVVEAV